MSESSIPFEGWGILELMGHVRLAGRITEETHFGACLGRIDVPKDNGFTTQYFSGGSIYRLTPTTEEIARSVAANNQPEPVHRWELPAPRIPDAMARAATGYSDDDGYNDIDADDEGDDDA